MKLNSKLCYIFIILALVRCYNRTNAQDMKQVYSTGVFSVFLTSADSSSSLPNKLPASVTSPTVHGDILLGFAGWTVTLNNCAVWINELKKNSGKLTNVTAVVAVKGPEQACYTGEPGYPEIASSLLQLCSTAERIIVAAHSSGSFTAHQFFSLLNTLDTAKNIIPKIRYYNLDGGIGETCGYLLEPDIARRLSSITAVYAKDTTSGVLSPNAETMQQLAGLYPANATEYVHFVQAGVCAKKWCLHQTLITQNPYKNDGFDLINDYGGLNAEHPVETLWLSNLK